MGPSANRVTVLALAVPAMIVALAGLLTLAMDLVGPHPLWDPPAVNMSEAAALRDPATVARLMRDGEDPDQPRTVRAGVLSERSIVLTPLEAAIAARRADIVEMLIAARPEADPSRWARARCLAMTVRDEDVRDAIDRHRPASAPLVDPACDTSPVPW